MSFLGTLGQDFTKPNHQPVGHDKQGWYWKNGYQGQQRHHYSQQDKPSAQEMASIPPRNPQAEHVQELLGLLTGLFGHHGGGQLDPRITAQFLAHIAPMLMGVTSGRKK